MPLLRQECRYLLFPQFNLPLEELEIPLNPVHSDRERIDQIEALGVFGQDRGERA